MIDLTKGTSATPASSSGPAAASATARVAKPVDSKWRKSTPSTTASKQDVNDWRLTAGGASHMAAKGQSQVGTPRLRVGLDVEFNVVRDPTKTGRLIAVRITPLQPGSVQFEKPVAMVSVSCLCRSN